MLLCNESYSRGVVCPKKLWLDANAPEGIARTAAGDSSPNDKDQVVALARSLFGPYDQVPYDPANPAEMVRRTAELIEAGAKVVCGAAFMYQDNLCVVDILKSDASGLSVIEVKPSTKNKRSYPLEVAYQAWVVRKSGYRLRSACLMYLNGSYRRCGSLDPGRMFLTADITREVRKLYSSVPRLIARIREVAASDAEPPCAVAECCFKPAECPYRAYCWRDVPRPNVFDIVGGRAKAYELYRHGVVTFEDALRSGVFGGRQLLQISTRVNGLAPKVDAHGIRDFLATLSYPLCYLDFESYMPAVPPFDGISPYEQVPTQYSLHIQESPGGPLVHREFFMPPGTDPRRAIAQSLCDDIPAGSCVLAYDMSFEKTTVRKLAGRFDDLAPRLQEILTSMRDLMRPFAACLYYCDQMDGSYSIKHILPALFPDDPELSYRDLALVHNGSQAIEAYGSLASQDPAEAEHTKACLLAYCRLDTLAMVRILERLRQVSDGS